jgi:hypothetical protein
MTTAEMVRGAQISSDGRYRYLLGRQWSDAPAATFIMLNPSTADADVDDPTVRRCIGFAASWGCGGLVVVNLYALRSTDPRALWSADDPVGPENDFYIASSARAFELPGAPLVAAWGAHAKADRVDHVLTIPGVADRLQCLGTTKAGAPRHPLYLRADAQLEAYRWSR